MHSSTASTKQLMRKVKGVSRADTGLLETALKGKAEKIHRCLKVVLVLRTQFRDVHCVN